MRIEGNAAIVTGGASGLGEATARMLAGLGAKVTLFDLNCERGEQLAREIGGGFVPVDVADEPSVTHGLDAAEALHGATRILVNCAGIGPPARAVGRNGQPQPLADFRRIVEINLVGTFNVASKFAARAMTLEPENEERGVIVNTSSVAAYDGQIGQSAYGASKSGIVGLTLPLAREFAQSGIRVMTIAPGLFLTPLLASLPEEAQRSLGQQVPFPSRLGHPDEYADLVRAIIANPMLNGESIRLDGAIRMAPR
ncbi:SDR family NAD(P)-dependent oxidoreductase [Sphingobium sp. 3R8]|uniref:SDR family NAD(P)-dependent oxidoreductase n=1 Tax=Sphingobium sp. 3R8 TaxID=2874921 RepID=UPI001CCF06BE|nr:SDR family NAD(P)-dependent oxidoreductase [Sphingobium sp. 3R8]MBZ9646880.1 SDR family NAD(P)-dependent oxidoreductase [Sphingobium sp. 3R8]